MTIFPNHNMRYGTAIQRNGELLIVFPFKSSLVGQHNRHIGRLIPNLKIHKN